MVSPDGQVVTRYAAGKLFLLGMTTERLHRLAIELRQLLDPESGPAAPDLAAATQRLHGAETGAVALLHQMHNLAGGVVPWRVQEQINSIYFDVRMNADAAGWNEVTGWNRVAADTARIGSLVTLLQEALLPDWDTRAKLPK